MKRIILVITAILVFSCHQKTNSEENRNADFSSQLESGEDLDWLIGNWKRLNEESGKETYENWTKITSNEYAGIGFTLQKRDTINQEKMNIINDSGKWSLYVKMPNETKATRFDITTLKKQELVCHNDTIDFPNKIHYWVEGDLLKATISNKEHEVLFEFEKVK